MTKKFNPLFDTRETFNSNVMTASEDNTIKTITASDHIVPLSPTTGKPMQKSYCRDVPVWVCAESRLVLPFKKEV
jgi:hypothetical protein